MALSLAAGLLFALALLFILALSVLGLALGLLNGLADELFSLFDDHFFNFFGVFVPAMLLRDLLAFA